MPPRPSRSTGPRRAPDQAQRRRQPRDPVRRAAFDVVHAVDDRDAYANLMLPSLLRERGLTGRDAALATELTYGTLRGRGTYDAVLGRCSDRPVAKIDTPDDTHAALAPEKVAGAHAATLTSGSTGMAPGPYTTDSRNALVKVQAGLQRRGVTLTADFAPDRQRAYALRTTDGGALVWYVLRQTEKYDMNTAGAVGSGGDLTGLVNGRVGRHLDTTALIQYLATVPSHGSPQVIGSYRKAVQATTS
jgi:hypothetical protein